MSYLDRYCRLCTNSKNVSSTIMSLDLDNLLILNKLKTIMPGILEIDKELPVGVCTSCSTELNIAYKFVKKCIKSQEYFKIHSKMLQNETFDINYNENTAEENSEKQSKQNDINIENNNLEAIYIKEEIKIDEETDYDSNLEDNVDEDFPTNLCIYDEAESSNILSRSNIDPNAQQIILIKNHTCEICQESFNGIEYLALHVYKNHKKFYCQLCEKILTKCSNLKDHQCSKRKRTGKDKRPNTCEVCKKTFKQLTNLNRHRMIHTGEKRFRCEVCSKAFQTSSHLKVHNRIHTLDKPHKCHICEKGFVNTSHLKRHIFTHTNVRPYACEICGKSFVQNSNLKTHIRLHTNVRPYSCTLCEKSFNDSSSLKVHIRIHTNEKPYRCTICGKAYNHGPSLKKHLLTHTHNSNTVAKI